MADEKSRKRKRRVVKLRRIFGFFVLIVLASVVWLNWDYLSPESIMLRIERAGSLTGKTEKYPLDISGKRVSALGRLGEQGLLVTDSGYYRLADGKAEEFSHSLRSVALSTADKYALLYEKGGTGYILESAGGRIAMRSSDLVIGLADIAPNGNYALLVKVTDYATKLVIYSSAGKELFSKFETSAKISGMAFCIKGDRCAVTSVDTTGGAMISTVTVYDISTGQAAAVLKHPGQLVVHTRFDSDGGLCVLGDKAMVWYGSDLTESSKVDYRGRTLLSYARDDDKTALLFQTDDPLSGRVVELYQGGELRYTISTDRKAKGLSLLGDKISLLDKEQLLVYEKDELSLSVSAPAGSVKTLISKHTVYEIDQNQVVAHPLKNNANPS